MIDLATLLRWAFQTAVAFIATLAFAVIFHTPRRGYLPAGGVTGATGWLVYLMGMHFGVGTVMASFFAAVTMAWLARVFAFTRKAPVTIFLICGIFLIVPGAGIYYTGYHFFMSDNAQALSKGLETIKIAVAIALGIGIILSLPQVLFTFRRKK